MPSDTPRLGTNAASYSILVDNANGIDLMELRDSSLSDAAREYEGNVHINPIDTIALSNLTFTIVL